ncbi:autotransporter-associated beta strand repeat-containing protein [Rhodanobacter sp. 7MK24]|uniref:autotransporter-associated beta strand repeat-containing protein n=1 Tax=Rhodanobacter sp. 7MK24 TaxID=2775922 RepID=UPI001784424B|nr:autotransporter-associated beta strand repeat-containing protein [Rhodanobacter sp. 7MK24]MBD8880802.1 autotransporter-associated beta strand repeat-containing protein [Rhodanobacter sp. 7MK24]
MNRVYRLIWNRALAVVQVTSELTRTKGSSSGASATRVLRRRPLALAIATMTLACVTAPAWSQTCTSSDPSGCGASGGIGGRPGRSPDGGAGNGTGGDAIVWNPNTSESAGSTATNGTGGNGADGVFDVGSVNITATGGAGGSAGAIGSPGVVSSVTGGTGGAGQAESGSSIVGGGGGGGGAGVYINDGNSSPIVGTTTTIAGGAGGRGGDATASASNGNATNGDPGGGGGGGAGAVIAAGAGGVSLINNGRLLGGAGGAGGNGGYAGSGGGGGDGLLVLGVGAAITNNSTGTIIGGLGGNAGIYQDGGNLPGGYGSGGAGVNLVGVGSSLENAGTIIGGNANTASAIPSAQDGTPGVGVRGWGGVTVVTDGSIAGGSNGSMQADSLLFSGGGNQLVVLSGASFTGNIQSISGSTGGGDIFTLAGDVNGSLDAALINGFASNTKTGNSNWTLTGTGNAGTDWTVQQGVLTGSASAFEGNLTFASNGIGTPVVDFNQAAAGSFAGSVSGTGQVIKDGAGPLTLSGDLSTFSGAFTINQGSVLLTGNGNLQGAEVADGGALDVSGTSGATATVAGISGNGTVTLGTHTLVIDNAANDDFSGAISGTGGVTLNGGIQTFSGANAYLGATTLNGGTLVVSADANLGQSTAVLAFNGGTLENDGVFVTTRNISLVGTGTLQTDADLTVSGNISGNGTLIKTGTGTLTLNGSNSYIGGTTVSAGTLQGDTNSLQGDITDNAALVFNQAANGTYVGTVSGSGTLTKTGTGTLTLAGGNSYSGGTTISAGTLQGDANSLQGNIVNDAALVFNQTGSGIYDGAISGTGTLTTSGSGTLTLNGVNTANGLTTVASGSTLLIGDSSHSTATVGGDVSVNGGTLGGYGIVQGSVMLANGASLTPGSALAAGTLTVNGDFTIGAGSLLNFDFGSPGPNFSTPGQSDHVMVNGNLSIGSSTLNVNNLGSMGPGLYNLFEWGGSLSITGGGFAPPSGMTLQILTVSKQINLVDTLGVTLNEWDANGLASPTQLGGGSGTWSLSSNTWSDTTGQYIGPMSPQPGFAIFGGASGTVTVDDTNGTVGATGMQFVSDGYHLTGGAIDLVGQGGAAPVLRVSSGDTATIDNVLDGVNGLNKTDGGTLVLNGVNSYTGTTILSGGTLSVSSDANLGASTNPLDFEGGTLEVTGTTFDQTARSMVWGNPGGGFDIDNAANVFTVAQALTGSGGLAKSGAGVLSLTGADTYAGDTTISAGTLSLSGSGNISHSADVSIATGATFDIGNTQSGASIVSLDGSGVVNLGNQTLTLTQASGNFAGTISGTGRLTLASGNETLSGSNLYTGATVIDGGTLALSGSGALAHSSDVNVASGAIFDITGTSNGASIVSLDGNGTVSLGGQVLTLTNAAGNFGGTITGNGGITLAGGTETLGGSNTYLGGTTISGGTLSVSSDANLGDSSGSLAFNGGTLANTASFNTARNITLAGGGLFDTVGNLTVSGNIDGSGALIKDGAGYLVLAGTGTYAGGTTVNQGTLQIGNNGTTGSIAGNVTIGVHGVLAFFRSDAFEFTGAISGSGTVVQGAGALILDGNSSGFAGTTTVQAGMLEVGDAGTPLATLGGNVTVASGGTLRGHGTIGGNVTNDGTLWAGGSIGTLTVRGNYTQAPDGVFEVEATPAGQATLLSVGGTANLAGTALVLADAGTWMSRTSYTVLTAAGGINGQFASASSSLPFLTPMLAYGTTTVTLSLQRNDINFSTVAQTPNQRAVATAADMLGFANAAYSALVVLDAPAARRAFDQLSGEIHASTRTAIQDDDRYVRDAIGQHLAGMTNNANGLNVTDDHGVTAWTSVWGHWGSHDGDGNASSFSANGSGMLVGADLPVGDDARLGAIIGSGQGTTRIATLGSSSHVLDQHIGIYGMAQTGPLQWQGGAIYGLQHVDTNRFIGFGSFAGTAQSDYHAHAAQGYVDASWPIAFGNAMLAPFANLAYDNLHTPAFGESGTPAALDVASQDSGVGYATLGLRATFDLGAPNHGLHAHASLGWQRAWGDTLPTTTERFAGGGDSFEIAGLPVAQDAAAISGGISFTITPTVSADASYQGQFGHRASDQAARISLDWKF